MSGRLCSTWDRVEDKAFKEAATPKMDGVTVKRSQERERENVRLLDWRRAGKRVFAMQAVHLRFIMQD